MYAYSNPVVEANISEIPMNESQCECYSRGPRRRHRMLLGNSGAGRSTVQICKQCVKKLITVIILIMNIHD
jgi:hypothetical protein